MNKPDNGDGKGNGDGVQGDITPDASLRDVTAAKDVAHANIRMIRTSMTEAMADVVRIRESARGVYDVAKKAEASADPRVHVRAGNLYALYLRLCVDVVKMEDERAKRALPAGGPTTNIQVNFGVQVSEAQREQLDHLGGLIDEAAG